MILKLILTLRTSDQVGSWCPSMIATAVSTVCTAGGGLEYNTEVPGWTTRHQS